MKIAKYKQIILLLFLSVALNSMAFAEPESKALFEQLGEDCRLYLKQEGFFNPQHILHKGRCDRAVDIILFYKKDICSGWDNLMDWWHGSPDKLDTIRKISTIRKPIGKEEFAEKICDGE